MADLKTLSAKIQDYLKEHPKDYAECVVGLQKIRDDDFSALHPETNPVILNMEGYDARQLAFVIVEYSAFSNEAIHMLVDAMIRDHDWELLKKEIEHNIAEEKGQETKGIPHLEMMRQGYRLDLKLETDGVRNSAVTVSFLEKMRNIFKHDDNAFSAGALLAFEGTAIDEFHVLDRIVREYKARLGGDLKKGSLTNLYIDGHKDFEIGHEAGLRDSIAPYINADNIHRFIRGYFSVCLTMNTWWEQLAHETYFRMTYHELSVSDTEIFDVSAVFEK